ncbi:MAG: hypothetical protein ABSF03_30705 [Streptosporangiaceae bacterium]
MSAELGAWLHEQREARGWTKLEMARQIIETGRAAGDNSLPGIDSMCHNIRRWEAGEGGLTERYKLYHCRAFGIYPSQFGPGQSGQLPGTTTETIAMAVSPVPPATPMLAAIPPAIPNLASPDLPAAATVAYRGRQEPGLGRFRVEQEVLMAAHDGSDHAEEYEQHGIGETTFEQLRADLVRLSRLTDTGEPLAVFLDMRRVRDRIYRLLDRRLWPREQTDLHFLLGCVNGLMGVTANRLGYPDAAEELIRAGYASAAAVDHRPLRGMLRVNLSYIMYWRGWFRESRDLAADGLRYVPQGPLGANLHLNHARAAARLGDLETARQAVGLALGAQESGYRDELVEIGGEEFALSQATTHSMAGATFAEIGGGEREAAAELERAISLYDEGPGPGEQHWFGGKALAGTDLAVIRLRSGALDAAAAALEPVLILAPSQRVSALTARLARVRDELTAPIFRGSPQARDLGDQIEEFGREAVTAGLHSLSGLS